MNNDYGFIITRHVNNELTNRYWNTAVKRIRCFYPHRPIVVIDDNSIQQFVSAEHEYQNITYVQSEFPKRGELLPYIYLLKYKWFPCAVILHDSVFIHKHIPFEKLNVPVMPLWHHEYDRENLNNLMRIVSALNHKHRLKAKLTKPAPVLPFIISSKDSFQLCFGCQCFIRLSFLEKLEAKYKLTNLVNVVHNRPDRCSLERIMGLLFSEECSSLHKCKSLFGDIMSKHRAFQYSYADYETDIIKNRVLVHPFVKVWTGR